MESHKAVPSPANGNRLTRTLNGATETYTYDDGDKLASVVGGGTNKTFGYDAAGRRTSMVSWGLTTTYSYDFESRLVSLAGPGIAAQYAYNGLGARVSAVENGNARTFRRDGDYVTDPVLSDGASAFTPGLSVRNGGSSRFFFDDRMGTATKETDSAQTVTATRTYDAFGNFVASSGASPSPFGYAGGYGYQEDATGLKLLGHRYYDPTTGRFLTRDPIRDGRNWYAYCSNNPLRWVDPSGLVPVIDIIRKGIARGKLPPGTADRYRKDRGFRDRIHRELGDQKKGRGGKKRNPDLSEDEVIDIVRDQLEFRRTPKAAPPPEVNWELVGKGALLVGLVIVGGVIIVASGGTAAGPVVAGGAAIIGGVLVVPATKPKCGL